MTNLIITTSDPDYCFSSDEFNTVLIWPDRDEIGGEMVECLHTRQQMEDGEIVEHLIFNREMPGNGDEYEEMIADIINNEPYEAKLI